MTFQATAYRILIVAPNDVASELKVIQEIIWSWNTKLSAKWKIFLLPTMWATNAAPDATGTSPAELNRQISRECDMLIGVFWKSIGPGTGSPESGVIEEIQEIRKAGKPVMMYLSSALVDPAGVNMMEYEKLMNFVDDCLKRDLAKRYESIADFKKTLSMQLASLILDAHKMPEEGTSKGPDERSRRESVDLAANRFSDLVKRFDSAWTSEKNSTPIDLDGGRQILKDLEREIADSRASLAEILGKETAENIDLITSNIRTLQKHRLYLDGKSFADFWKMGDEIFAALDALIVTGIRGMPIPGVDDGTGHILVELSKLEDRTREPMPADAIANAVGLSTTEVTRYLGDLLKTGCISQLLATGSQPRYFLSDAGRKFLVERGIR